MPTWNGSYSQAASYNRLRAEFVTTLRYPGGSRDASDTYVDVDWTLRLRKHPDDASGSFIKDTSTFSISSPISQSGSKAWPELRPNGVTTIASGTHRVNLTYSPQNIAISATIDHVTFAGTPSVSGTLTIPARPFYSPNDPTEVEATRESDARMKVGWSLSTSSSRPVSGVEVRRCDNINTSWVSVANLTGAPLSWFDTTIVEDRIYEYDVRAKNADGNSNRVSTGLYPTTPATPTGAVTAAKDENGNIIVTRPALSASATSWAVRREDGTVLATGIPKAQDEWVHSSPAPEVWAYQVAAESSRTGTGAYTLTSGWSPVSNAVPLLAPPNKPGVFNSLAGDATEDIALPFVHNPVDTTSMTAFQVRHRRQGSPSWATEAVEHSPIEEWALPADTYTNGGNPVEVQFMTWGTHATGSPWSDSGLLNLSARPTAAVVYPSSGTHGASRLTAVISYYDPEGSTQTMVEATLRSDDWETIEQRTIPGPVVEVPFSTALENNTSWTLDVRVRDGAGLWSNVVTEAFSVEYPSPVRTRINADWDDSTGIVTLNFDSPTGVEDLVAEGGELHVQETDPGAVPDGDVWLQVSTGDVYTREGGSWVLVAPEDIPVDVETVSIYRQAGPGRYHVIGRGLPPSGSISDHTAPLNADVVYIAVGESELGALAFSPETTVTTATQWVFINWGPGFVEGVRFRGGVRVSRSTSRVHQSLHRLAGADLPMERVGRQINRTYSLQAVMYASFLEDDGTSRWEDVDRLVTQGRAPVLVRDPEGIRIFVSVQSPDNDGHLEHTPTVSIPMTEVEHKEEVVTL